MKFTELHLKGAYLIETTPFQDQRGFFTRTFCENEFAEHGLKQHFVQANHSGTFGKGIIRGMHFQRPPHAEVKVLKCIKGSIFDVIVDCRKGSDTFLQWYGVELSAEKKNMLYVPAGFAHGFQSLEEETEITYLVGAFYNKESEGGIHHLDPKVNIKWPLPVLLTSDKDAVIPFVDENFVPIDC